MATLPSRKSLESMKRADLQRICKDYGVKANLKSEALIDLLLDTQKPPKSAPTRRVVSTKVQSRAGPSRVSSIIVHNTDAEDTDEEQEVVGDNPHGGSSTGYRTNTQPTMKLEQSLLPMTRTRKAKEQTRLGVGRPVAAGGAGPRAVTKSMSVPRAPRGKGSRSMKPSEATIPEEEPDLDILAESTQERQPIASSNAVNRQTHFNTDIQTTQNPLSNNSLASLEAIDKHVADALRPLHEQLESLKAELELMQLLKTEFNQLKTEVDNMGTLKQKVEALAAEVVQLRTQAASVATTNMESGQWNDVKSNIATTSISTTSPSLSQHMQTEPRLITHPESGPELSNPPSTSNNIIIPPYLSTTPTMLGKRDRDSSISDTIEDEGGEHLESDPTQRTMKPSRKRPKTMKNDGVTKAEVSSQTILRPEGNESTVRVPSFTIFNDQDEPPEQYPDPPPPTDRLPNLFMPPSLPGSGQGQGVTAMRAATASENHQAFRFSFLPMSSTPAHSMFMPSFPYPEPPQSPSPAGPSTAGLPNHHQGERTDVFQAFGLPSPVRPSRSSALRTAGPPSQCIDPADLINDDPGKGGEESLTKYKAVGQTKLEPNASGPSRASPSGPEMKRTMYGTELDGDTRFGDFGVEGVGTSGAGFWAGGRY